MNPEHSTTTLGAHLKNENQRTYRNLLNLAQHRSSIELRRFRIDRLEKESGGTRNQSKRVLPITGSNHLEGESLANFWDQIVLISANDVRSQDFLKALPSSAWPFQKPDLFPELKFQTELVPDKWKAHASVWIWLRTHLRLIEDALNHGRTSLLIINDQFLLDSSFCESIVICLRKLPPVWHQIFFSEMSLQAYGIHRRMFCFWYAFLAEALSDSINLDSLNQRIQTLRRSRQFFIFEPEQALIGES